jgi:hypothetical protein
LCWVVDRHLRNALVEGLVIRGRPPAGRPRLPAREPAVTTIRTRCRCWPKSGWTRLQALIEPHARHQGQIHQRPHRTISAQHCIGQLEQRIRPQGQRRVELLPEPSKITGRARVSHSPRIPARATLATAATALVFDVL